MDAGAIVAALDGGADMTIATTAPGSDAGTIFVGANVAWSGDGDLRLVADDSLTVNYNMLSTGAGDLTIEAGTDFILDAKILAATGSGDLTIDAGRDLAIRAHPTNAHTISTEDGRLAIDVGRDVFIDRNVAAVGPHNTQIYSTSGALDMTAGRAIDLRGGALGGTWVRVGQQGSSADVTLRAPTVSFRGGGAGNTYAELVGGAEGSITVAASERIVFANGAGDQGRVQASNDASLTLRAPVQVWDGPVRAGSGAQDGGETVIAGAVSASFQPQFSLRRGANFTNETNLRLGMKVPSIRTRTQNLFGVLALDWQDSANVTGFGPGETTEDDRLLVLAAGAEWDRADRFGGVTLAKATIRQGLDTSRSFIGGGPSYGVDAFPLGALELSRLQRLGDGPWALWLEGIGQRLGHPAELRAVLARRQHHRPRFRARRHHRRFGLWRADRAAPYGRAGAPRPGGGGDGALSLRRLGAGL